jgi:hypothetical protein
MLPGHLVIAWGCLEISDMHVFSVYIAPLLVLLLFLAGTVAQFVIDAHHWMPRNWWPRSLFSRRGE